MSLKSELIHLALSRMPATFVRYYYLRERWRGDAALVSLARLVRKGDVVLDIGAYRGIYTYALRRLVGPTGHVYAFEPNPTSLPILTAANVLHRNVTIMPIALSNSAGHAELAVPAMSNYAVDAMASLAAGARQRGDTYKTVSVRRDRLDAVLDPSLAITFAKCDVEGHELEMLEGARETLSKWKPAVVIEIEQRHQERPISDTFDWFRQLGYRGYGIAPDRFIPLSQFDVHTHQEAFLSDRFQTRMPHGYVSDFLFVNPHSRSAGRAAFIEQ